MHPSANRPAAFAIVGSLEQIANAIPQRCCDIRSFAPGIAVQENRAGFSFSQAQRERFTGAAGAVCAMGLHNIAPPRRAADAAQF
jgi:hypothetical protein